MNVGFVVAILSASLTGVGPFDARPCDASPGFLFVGVIKFGVSQLGYFNE